MKKHIIGIGITACVALCANLWPRSAEVGDLPAEPVKANRYTEIDELTGELLNLFIERIEVGERGERYSRTAEQKIVIRYRDIGVVGAFAEEAEKICEQQQRQTA